MSGTAKRKTILIVDDQAINRKILANMVKYEYDYREAVNGRDALEKLEKGDTEFSLILLDLIMPVMDGYAFLQEIRSFPEFAHIPIIVLTSSNIVTHEKRALRMGATDFITKPYNPEIVKIKIDTLLELQKSISQSSMVKKDFLTQLYTKEEFFIEGANIVRSMNSNNWSVICIDFANLTTVNSIGGYSEGDKLLQSSAKMVQDLIVKYDGIAGRTWSDTFAILLPGVRDIKQIQHDMDEAEAFFENYPLNISVCVKVGFASAITSDNTLRRIYDNAKLAINDIKKSYFSDINIYDDALDDRLRTRIELAEDVNKALLEHQFMIYLQPKVDMMTNRLIVAESLVRWDHPERGILTPNIFIPIFEDNGLITEIDKYVFRETCSLLHDMDQHGIRKLPVSVNISRMDLFDKDLTSTLVEYTRMYDVDPSLIHIEITETVYMLDSDLVNERIHSFINEGFKIEMDDFGSQYSSLTVLTEMPLDLIKLDVQFLFNRKNNRKQEAVFKFINMLAIELNKPVIVEGVSTKEDVEFLLRNNFRYAQGYYYSKPLPVDDFMAYYISSLEKDPDNVTDIENNGIYTNAWLTDLRYSNFIEQMPFGFMIFDSDNAIKFMSDHVISMLEYGDPDNAVSYYNSDVKALLTHESAALLFSKASALLESGDTRDLFYLEFSRKTLSNLVVPAYLYSFESASKINWVLMILTDLAVPKGDSETDTLVHKINRLEKEVQFDRLTQLYNRFYFERLVDHELKTHGQENAFVFIDLDNFKSKNDLKGHQYGDHVLRSFSKMLKRSFRGDDFICRMGGDEFCIFARNVNATAALEAHMAKLQSEALRELDLSFSYGIVLSPESGITFDELYNASDAAMYASKKENKMTRTSESPGHE